MKKRNLISLEKLEYEVYKNEVEVNKPKLITLEHYFNISVVPHARANQQVGCPPHEQTNKRKVIE